MGAVLRDVEQVESSVYLWHAFSTGVIVHPREQKPALEAKSNSLYVT